MRPVEGAAHIVTRWCSKKSKNPIQSNILTFSLFVPHWGKWEISSYFYILQLWKEQPHMHKIPKIQTISQSECLSSLRFHQPLVGGRCLPECTSPVAGIHCVPSLSPLHFLPISVFGSTPEETKTDRRFLKPGSFISSFLILSCIKFNIEKRANRIGSHAEHRQPTHQLFIKLRALRKVPHSTQGLFQLRESKRSTGRMYVQKTQ